MPKIHYEYICNFKSLKKLDLLAEIVYYYKE